MPTILSILIIWTMLFLFASTITWGMCGFELCEFTDQIKAGAAFATAVLFIAAVIFGGIWLLGATCV